MSESAHSQANSSPETESSSSPFRGSRFKGQTRRAAIERRFGKIVSKSPTDDEKKEESPPSPPPVVQEATPLVSNRRATTGSKRVASVANEFPAKSLESTSYAHASSQMRSTVSQNGKLDGQGESDALVVHSQKHPQHLDESTEVSYYRVVYRGVVSLLSSPDIHASRSGCYLGYGEIFRSQWQQELIQNRQHLSARPRPLLKEADETSNSREPMLSDANLPKLPSLPTQITDDDILTTATKVVRVDEVVTGGYSADSRLETERLKHDTAIGGNALDVQNITTKDSMRRNHGFLFSRHNNSDIIELLPTGPRVEEGTFLYKVVSTAPLPILSGPSVDAPKTKALVLPGSIHDVSLRVTLELEHGNVSFLRLCHRRGWIADRVGATSAVVLKEVEHRGSEIDDGESSVLSCASILSTVTIPSSVSRSRHRPPRRRTDVNQESHHKSHLSINNVLFPATTPKKSTQSSQNERYLTEKVTSPNSNVSLLSDEDSSLDQSAIAQETHPTSPGASFATSKSASSAASGCTTMFLMRVTAPRGLKILDAPHFQVSNLIHGKTGKPSVSSSHMVSQLESNIGPPKTHHSIFQTMSGRLTTTGPSKTGNPAIFDASSRTRILPRGVLFEASRRMESTGAFNQGAGLIKLSDNSGWAIVPRKDELDEQYRNFHGLIGVKEGEATQAFVEVGSAALDPSSSDASASGRTGGVWYRVQARPGLVVSCPPPVGAVNDGDTSPTSSRGSSTVSGSNAGSGYGIFAEHNSDVASSVGSAFLDAMFRTPKKKRRDGEDASEGASRHTISGDKPCDSIPCGICIEAERVLESHNPRHQEYVRLRGGQGWVPLVWGGKNVCSEIQKPESRFGSFWFRVQSSRGIKARLGPSKKAPSIKSDDGIYFRFECGEFLRASEILTILDQGQASECFAKLYRNRHVQLHRGHEEYRQLASLTSPAEWVQIHGRDELYLEECAAEPHIERHRQGWRYNVVPESGIAIRKGPSFAAETTGTILYGGESVVVNERVSPGGEKIVWLRLKDGQGWVHDIDADGNEIMIAHSLRHRVLSRPQKARTSNDGKEVAYNTIVARLFHNENPDDAFHTSVSKRPDG